MRYCLARQGFCFPCPIPEIQPFEISDAALIDASSGVPRLFPENESPQLISRTKGWVGGAQRNVEVYDMSHGFILKVENGGEFYIAPHGETINKANPQEELSKLDREIILGPALVLALALRGTWSLHASAALFQENVIVFLGESGQGKSTLGAYLSRNAGWRLVADDILPVKTDNNEVKVLPHFPQLKLPLQAQPGVGLPEQLPLKNICVLEPVEPGQIPELQKISTTQGVQALLSHTAGTRMFDASLLEKHLEFCAQAARMISYYKLAYPHRRDALPEIEEILKTLC